MIIIKVLVDEMPSGCKRCDYCVAEMYCLLLEDRKTTVPDEPYKRRPDCPLVYDFSDKQINDLTARIAELEMKNRHNALWQASVDAEERAHLEKLVPDLKKRIAELEERLELCESALTSMVYQFFYSSESGALVHSFMSAEEEACEYLIKYGIAHWSNERKNSIVFDEVQE